MRQFSLYDNVARIDLITNMRAETPIPQNMMNTAAPGGTPRGGFGD